MVSLRSALAEDLSTVPSTHIVSSQLPATPGLEDRMSLVSMGISALTCTYYTHIHIKTHITLKLK